MTAHVSIRVRVTGITLNGMHISGPVPATPQEAQPTQTEAWAINCVRPDAPHNPFSITVADPTGITPGKSYDLSFVEVTEGG